MNTYQQSSSNIRKTWLLMAGFLIFIIAIGWAASYYYGNPFILYIAVGFSLLANIFSYYRSDKIALSINGARPADRNQPDEAQLIRSVETLAIAAGLPTPGIYVMDDTSMNAFATGRDPKHSAVAATKGLLAKLDKSELDGVVAHELSHIANRDILVATIAVTLVGVIAILSDIFMRMSFWGGGSDNRDGRAAMILMVVGIAAAILAPIAAKLIQLAISRKREFLADASGALLTRHPEGLARALEKISQHSQPMARPSSATAHMFIANPFGPEGVQKWAQKIFSTHPPVAERLAALRGMDGRA